MYLEYNPNPLGLTVGDCVIRAVCKALGKEWEDIYMDLCVKGLEMGDMPSANRVWGAYLKENGFHRVELPDDYTVYNFCRDHPTGTYILATGTHVVTVQDGNYYDAWDSGLVVPTYYWSKDV